MYGMDAESKIMKEVYRELTTKPRLTHAAIAELWRKYTQAADKCLGMIFSFLLVFRLELGFLLDSNETYKSI